MRHRKAGRKLGVTSSHRSALLRNMTASLILSEKEQVITTLEKAKEVKRYTEKLITLAKNKTLANYRRALNKLQNEPAVARLFNELGPRYQERPGGYARITHLAGGRRGDNASRAVLALVTEPLEKKEKIKSPKAETKKTDSKSEKDKSSPEKSED